MIGCFQETPSARALASHVAKCTVHSAHMMSMDRHFLKRDKTFESRLPAVSDALQLGDLAIFFSCSELRGGLVCKMGMRMVPTPFLIGRSNLANA